MLARPAHDGGSPRWGASKVVNQVTPERPRGGRTLSRVSCNARTPLGTKSSVRPLRRGTFEMETFPAPVLSTPVFRPVRDHRDTPETLS